MAEKEIKTTITDKGIDSKMQEADAIIAASDTLRIATLLYKEEVYEKDPLLAFYFQLVRKQNEIVAAMDEYNIDLAGDDKGFERFWKIATENSDVIKAIESLEGKIKERFSLDDVAKVKAELKIPFIEQVANSKKRGV